MKIISFHGQTGSRSGSQRAWCIFIFVYNGNYKTNVFNLSSSFIISLHSNSGCYFDDKFNIFNYSVQHFVAVAVFCLRELFEVYYLHTFQLIFTSFRILLLAFDINRNYWVTIFEYHSLLTHIYCNSSRTYTRFHLLLYILKICRSYCIIQLSTISSEVNASFPFPHIY